MAGVGDLVAKVDKQRDLVNAFGKADIFGRKTDEGYSELRFAGVASNGDVMLYRTDVNIVSNETTMSRTPFSSTYSTGRAHANAYVNGNRVSAYGSGSETSTTIAPIPDYHQVIPAGAVTIDVQKNDPVVVFEGHTITIESATPTVLHYHLDN